VVGANRVPVAVVGDMLALALRMGACKTGLVGYAESKVWVGWKQSSRNEATPITIYQEPRLPSIHAASNTGSQQCTG
jgi:hypothetical protein